MAIIFYLSLLVLAVIAVICLVPVILRQPSQTSINRDQKNIEIAKNRLGELQQQRDKGEIPQSDALEIQQEIERELLDDIEAPEHRSNFRTRRSTRKVNQWAAVTIGTLIPVTAGLLYLLLGEPSVIGNSALLVTQSASTKESSELPQSIEQMVQTLETHLEVQSQDAQGWLALAQLYLVEGQFAKASVAYGRVRELTGESADILVREADALAMARNGNLTGEPEALIAQALQMDPNHTSGLWLAGLAAAAKSDYHDALIFWTRAESNITDQEMLFEIRRLINDAQQKLGQDSAFAGQSGGPVVGGSAVRVQVSIDPSLHDKINRDDTLFVFARAIEGVRVPLAVARRKAGDLPLEIVLDDSLAMVPNMTISNFDEISITSRISKSGAAEATTGDYFGETGVIRPGSDREVDIIISQRVP